MSGLALGSTDKRASTETVRASLLSLGERWTLAMRLTLSMFAAGLLGIALLWRVLFPAESGIAELVAGLAALLVAVPVLSAAWSSLRHPSLHGMSDQLVALALVACWATGDLMTAAILPIVMIIGHVLEERSLLGSREAIDALGRLVQSTSILVRENGAHEEVPTQALRVGDRIALRAGDRVPVDGIIRQGAASMDTASLTGESVPIDAVEGDVVLADDRILPLDKTQHNYLCNVLRLSEGGVVHIFNGRDGEWRSTLRPVGRKAMTLRVESCVRPQTPKGDLHYLFAPLKHARLDYMVQKAVEMGASRLVPVSTRRTQTGRINLDRMRANAIEAAEQCGILVVPEIDDLVSLDKVLADWPTAESSSFATRMPKVAPFRPYMRSPRAIRSRY